MFTRNDSIIKTGEVEMRKRFLGVLIASVCVAFGVLCLILHATTEFSLLL